MLDITFRNYNIIIGKNEEENDTLVEEAKPNDYWLHLSFNLLHTYEKFTIYFLEICLLNKAKMLAKKKFCKER